MEIISHRRNTVESLLSTDKNLGIEVDVRSWEKEIIINHDPFKGGILFSDWIKYYDHGTLIINVKEDGMEKEILTILRKNKVKSYFFLDQSFPSLIKCSNEYELNCAVRVSEYESVETALNLANKVNWIWVDLFTKFPINKKKYEHLKNANFKLCLVSPELQINNKLQIKDVRNIIEKEKIFFDAVCTKFPQEWQLN